MKRKIKILGRKKRALAAALVPQTEGTFGLEVVLWSIAHALLGL